MVLGFCISNKVGAFAVLRRWSPAIRMAMSTTTASIESTEDLDDSSGPRMPLSLGLPAARATSNILRLLEANHDSTFCTDTFESIRHEKGKVLQLDGDSQIWKGFSRLQTDPDAPSNRNQPPALKSLEFADDRTALAVASDGDGRERSLALLRLEEEMKTKSTMKVIPNDGWVVIRELVERTAAVADEERNDVQNDSIVGVLKTLQDYMRIEHGGGAADRREAEVNIFSPETSLLAVGSSPAHKDDDNDAWSAKVGHLLEIPLSVYLDGVESQTPHQPASSQHDKVIQITTLPCQTAATATVHVGNGACTTLFVDHLFLGKEQGRWKILSKVFTPREWPM